jgi:hypothetical protein
MQPGKRIKSTRFIKKTKYNRDNYVFAGFNYSEKTRVLYPRKKGRFAIYKK